MDFSKKIRISAGSRISSVFKGRSVFSDNYRVYDFDERSKNEQEK
jgi:hypothetical protein